MLLPRQTNCYDATNAVVACSNSGVGSDAGANPRQDDRFGLDAKIPQKGEVSNQSLSPTK